MRSEVQHHLLLAFPKDHGIGQGRHARADFDRASTGIVHDTIFESPTVGVPGPTGNGVVDQGGPEERPDEEGHESASLGDSTCHDGSRDTTELHLSRHMLEQIQIHHSTKHRAFESSCIPDKRNIKDWRREVIQDSGFQELSSTQSGPDHL